MHIIEQQARYLTKDYMKKSLVKLDKVPVKHCGAITMLALTMSCKGVKTKLVESFVEEMVEHGAKWQKH